MTQTHTKGPLTVNPYNFITIHDANGDLAADCGNFTYTEEGEVQLDTCIPTAQLLTAAYNSYDKHCGPNAIACAEGDLLGEALAALKALYESCEYAQLRKIARSVFLKAKGEA